MKKVLCLFLVFLFILNVALISCGNSDETTEENTGTTKNQETKENDYSDSEQENKEQESSVPEDGSETEQTELETTLALLNSSRVKDILSKENLEAIFYVLPDSVSNYDLGALLDKLFTERKCYQFLKLNTEDNSIETRVVVQSGYDDKIFVQIFTYYKTYNEESEFDGYCYDQTVLKIYFDEEQVLRCSYGNETNIPTSKQEYSNEALELPELAEGLDYESEIGVELRYDLLAEVFMAITIHKSDITTLKETVINLAGIISKALIFSVIPTPTTSGISRILLDTDSKKLVEKFIDFFGSFMPKIEATDIAITKDGFFEIQPSYIDKIFAIFANAFGYDSEVFTAENIGLKFAFKIKSESQKIKLDAIRIELAPKEQYSDIVEDLSAKLTIENILDKSKSSATLDVLFNIGNPDNHYIKLTETAKKIEFDVNIPMFRIDGLSQNYVAGSGIIEYDSETNTLTLNSEFENPDDEEEYYQYFATCTAEEISLIMSGVSKLWDEKSGKEVYTQIFSSLHIFKDFANNERPVSYIETTKPVSDEAAEPSAREIFSVTHSGDIYTFDYPSVGIKIIAKIADR